jgi:hypothetical protein
MIVAQTIADIGIGSGKVDVVGNEFLVHRTGLDDVIGDVVEDRQSRLRREDHAVVGQLEAAMLEG